jgi:hypothetical protein
MATHEEMQRLCEYRLRHLLIDSPGSSGKCKGTRTAEGTPGGWMAMGSQVTNFAHHIRLQKRFHRAWSLRRRLDTDPKFVWTLTLSLYMYVYGSHGMH